MASLSLRKFLLICFIININAFCYNIFITAHTLIDIYLPTCIYFIETSNQREIPLKKLYFKSFIHLYHAHPFSRSINQAIHKLQKQHPNLLSLYEIGHSVQGTPIFALYLGSGPIKLLIHGTHHAREAITTILILDQLQYLIGLYQRKACIQDISICALLKQVTFVFVPLVNPDGADLVLNGETIISPKYKNCPYLQKQLFPSWKANIRGVDLNENYPTKYPAPNLAHSPSSQLYPGVHPFSEPETFALKCLTEKKLFAGTISYHSSGEEIYWYYNQENTQRDLIIAKQIAQLTNYKLIPKKIPTTGSGYKDWFIETYQQPSLTIEVAPYVGPKKVPKRFYPSIFYKNKNVPIIFAKSICSS